MTFLTATTTPERPLRAALATVDVATAVSPWTPAPPPSSPIEDDRRERELAALTVEARERGHAEGLLATAELRARLVATIDALEAARAAVVPPAAELVADIVCTVLAGWSDAVDRRALFAPVIQGWLARTTAPATVRIHPSDLAAVTEACRDTVLTVVSDPALSPGALRVSSPTHELAHSWDARLGELRATIATVLAEPSP